MGVRIIADIEEENHIYIFNCPKHGPEMMVYCFRAFGEENKSLWEKYQVRFQKVDFEPRELERFLADFHSVGIG